MSNVCVLTNLQKQEYEKSYAYIKNIINSIKQYILTNFDVIYDNKTNQFIDIDQRSSKDWNSRILRNIISMYNKLNNTFKTYSPTINFCCPENSNAVQLGKHTICSCITGYHPYFDKKDGKMKCNKNYGCIVNLNRQFVTGGIDTFRKSLNCDCKGSAKWNNYYKICI